MKHVFAFATAVLGFLAALLTLLQSLAILPAPPAPKAVPVVNPAPPKSLAPASCAPPTTGCGHGRP